MPLAGKKLAGLCSLGTATDLTSTFFLLALDFSDNNRIPPGNADPLLGALKFLRDELMNWNHVAKEEILSSVT